MSTTAKAALGVPGSMTLMSVTKLFGKAAALGVLANTCIDVYGKVASLLIHWKGEHPEDHLRDDDATECNRGQGELPDSHAPRIVSANVASDGGWWFTS